MDVVLAFPEEMQVKKEPDPWSQEIGELSCSDQSPLYVWPSWHWFLKWLLHQTVEAFGGYDWRRGLRLEGNLTRGPSHLHLAISVSLLAQA